MKKLIDKLKNKQKDDIANFSKSKLKKHKEDENKKMLEQAEEYKKLEVIELEKIRKELLKFKDNEKEILKLQSAINKRFNVSKTKTKASEHKTAAVYFNAFKVYGMPKSYYPVDWDAPDFFTPGEPNDQPGYWLMMFQMNTAEDDRGHSIPNMPGTSKDFVIHGILFPMTSTTIYLGKFSFDKSYGVIYYPNDDLFHREDMSTYEEKYFKDYEPAYKFFLEIIERHLDGDEEKFYDKKKVI